MSLTSLLISNAVSLIRDKSILFSRVVIKSLILSGIIKTLTLFVGVTIGLYCLLTLINVCLCLLFRCQSKEHTWKDLIILCIKTVSVILIFKFVIGAIWGILIYNVSDIILPEFKLDEVMTWLYGEGQPGPSDSGNNNQGQQGSPGQGNNNQGQEVPPAHPGEDEERLRRLQDSSNGGDWFRHYGTVNPSNPVYSGEDVHIMVIDPHNQASNYVPGGNNQPFRSCIASSLELFYQSRSRLGLTKLSALRRDMFDPKTEGFMLDMLRHERPGIYAKVMHNSKMGPCWDMLNNSLRFRAFLRKD